MGRCSLCVCVCVCFARLTGMLTWALCSPWVFTSAPHPRAGSSAAARLGWQSPRHPSEPPAAARVSQETGSGARSFRSPRSLPAGPAPPGPSSRFLKLDQGGDGLPLPRLFSALPRWRVSHQRCRRGAPGCLETLPGFRLAAPGP